MIGFLNGKIDLLQRPNVIIDVNGVGYKVLVSENVYKNLTVGQKIKIFTYTYVRDDALELFGFLEIDDLKLFESLLAVSGIGPRTALNIFSFGERQNIIEAIVKGETIPEANVPESFKVLVRELNSLGLALETIGAVLVDEEETKSSEEKHEKGVTDEKLN